VTDAAPSLVEIRLFTLHPGTRAEFDRISREGTIPLMRRCGITVLTFGPCLNDDDGYVLVRAFPSEQERTERAETFYASIEWTNHYESRVTAMIANYRTAVLPATAPLASMRA
jgi:hypothetical protein